MSPRRKSNTEAQSFVSRAGWYSLRYPIDWTVREDETCIELCNPDEGVGALHVSAYRTCEPVDPKQELLENLEPTPDAQDIAVSLVGTKRIASFEAVSNLFFQKTWYISDKSYLVLATYNCHEENKDKEVEEVERIIRSIEF